MNLRTGAELDAAADAEIDAVAGPKVRLITAEWLAERFPDGMPDAPWPERKVTTRQLDIASGAINMPLVKPVTPDDAAPLVYAYGDDPYGGRRWLVHQMMPETGVALLSGQWGIGKTFTAIDMAVCAMFGLPFARHTVDRECGVLWLAAEGEAEINDRLKAALDARPELAGLPVPFVWADRFPLLLANDAVKQFEHIIGAARTRLEQLGAKLGLLILDTMAAGAGWDSENDAAEGQKAMNMLRKIARHYGCLVVAIDHYGKDAGSGTRGTTAKEAAADAVLALLGDRQQSGVILNKRMAVRKARGGIAGREYPFDLPSRKIGTDDQGREITTCTVEWTDKPRPADAKAASNDKLPPPYAVAWHEALADLLMRTGRQTVTRHEWLTEGIRLSLTEAVTKDDTKKEREAKRGKFRNALSELATAKWIEADGDVFRDRRAGSLADLVS